MRVNQAEGSTNGHCANLRSANVPTGTTAFVSKEEEVTRLQPAKEPEHAFIALGNAAARFLAAGTAKEPCTWKGDCQAPLPHPTTRSVSTASLIALATEPERLPKHLDDMLLIAVMQHKGNVLSQKSVNQQPMLIPKR